MKATSLHRGLLCRGQARDGNGLRGMRKAPSDRGLVILELR
jgi:hypothetical protein